MRALLPSPLAVSAGGEDGRVVRDNPLYSTDDHESHIEELTAEMERRDVSVRGAERREDSIIVDYDSENLDDDLAEVAIAFVERIDGGWGIDRLKAIALGETDQSWHAEAEWAKAYLDSEIEASEYGQRINKTLKRILVFEDEDE